MATGIPATTDAADEAGGEAIYSSDGLPPLPFPKAPSSTQRNVREGDAILDSEDLVDPSVDPEMLFSTYESPYEKLARLQREVTSLEFPSHIEESQELNRLVSELQKKLEASTKLSPQEDLAHLIEQHLAAQQGASKGAVDPQTNGVVYELYGGGGSVPSLMEERLIKIEQWMGGGADSSKSLLHRLQEMEEKIQKVDAKSLEDASIKAKVIRADLEAAAKAKSKISSGSSTADSKTIGQLHQELVQLEGLSSHLPALASRLEQLAHLHVQSSTTAARLGGAEQDLRGIQASLQSMNVAVAALESNMLENTRTMEANLKAMEDRVKQL